MDTNHLEVESSAYLQMFADKGLDGIYTVIHAHAVLIETVYRAMLHSIHAPSVRRAMLLMTRVIAKGWYSNSGAQEYVHQ